MAARLKNVDALQEVIEKVFASAPTVHWVKKLDAASVPGGPVYTYDEAVADPHIRKARFAQRLLAHDFSSF